MQRITIAIEDDLLAALDDHMQRSDATNRSEAVRDILRRSLRGDAPAQADCIGVVSYAMDLSVRDLGRRVPERRHARHDQTVAALSVPLDHDSALEVTVIRGTVGAVEAFANSHFAERGIRHGTLALIPVAETHAVHSHGEAEAHRHSHLKIRDSF